MWCVMIEFQVWIAVEARREVRCREPAPASVRLRQQPKHLLGAEVGADAVDGVGGPGGGVEEVASGECGGPELGIGLGEPERAAPRFTVPFPQV